MFVASLSISFEIHQHLTTFCVMSVVQYERVMPDNFVVVEKIKVAEQQPFINVFVYYHPLL
jgi:hypothetical protein